MRFRTPPPAPAGCGLVAVPDDVLPDADTAMYVAKRAGGCHVRGGAVPEPV